MDIIPTDATSTDIYPIMNLSTILQFCNKYLHHNTTNSNQSILKDHPPPSQNFLESISNVCPITGQLGEEDRIEAFPFGRISTGTDQYNTG